MEGILEFTSGNVATIFTYTNWLFTDLKLVLVLVIGLPLGFWVIRKIITMVRAR